MLIVVGGAYVPAFVAGMYAPFDPLSATVGRRHAIKAARLRHPATLGHRQFVE
ncbi:MAG: hypothetical protein ABSF46_20505 [Terriglobia bacterium]|jgi:hypothetical protein